MKISKETVRYVANLARLGLTDKEVEKFSGQLSAVFEYMEILEEVDTSDVAETSQVTGLENVKEKDEVVEWKVAGAGGKRWPAAELREELLGCAELREELLGCAELPIESNQILVKAAIKKQ